jgi:hypothetical protein
MIATHAVTHYDPDNCYGCKVKSLAVAYGSVNGVLQGAAGRNNFHGEHADGGTISERRRQMIEQARSKGVEPRELTRRERENFHSGARI